MEENTTQVQETTQETPQEQPQVDRKEQNLTAMRKKLEAEEAARKAAEHKAAEYERMLASNQAVQSPMQQLAQQDEDDLPVDNDDYIQAKHYKTSNKKTKSRLSEQEKQIKELNEKLAILEAKSEMDRIKDFNDVVNDDNLKTFQRLYPEDYAVVMSNPDLRLKSKAAYNMIKNYGIANPLLKDVDERVEANKRKPQSSSVSSPQSSASPLAGFNPDGRRVMTEAERDRILAEVERKRNMSRV